MKIGVAKEIKSDEYRVALTPAGARELADAGHDVLVEQNAGDGSAFPDDAYEAVGAQIVSVDDVWGDAELLLKVKEPIAAEYGRLRDGLVLFTYLHLAADNALTNALVESGISAVAYETVETPNRHLPLLAVELGGGHRRIGKRVLDHRGHSTGRGRHGAGGEVLALGMPGILEVGVHVDGAGQHHQAGGVYQLVGAAAVGPLGDRGDAAVLDHDVCRKHAVVGGQRAAGDHGALAAHGGEVLCRAMAGTEPSKAIVSSLWIRRLRAQRLRDTRFVLMSSSARRSLLGVEGVREYCP